MNLTDLIVRNAASASRPTSVFGVTRGLLGKAGRIAAPGADRRPGRVGAPAPVSEPRRGRFSHLAGAGFERAAPPSGYTALEIQQMWLQAFANIGVKVTAGPTSSRRPTRNRTEAQWDQAFARLIKASF
jgi:hypothetical protein